MSIRPFIVLLVAVEVVEFHAKMISAAISLRQNLALMRRIDTDYVGGLIGTQNTEDLALVFSDINGDIQDLEEKYNL